MRGSFGSDDLGDEMEMDSPFADAPRWFKAWAVFCLLFSLALLVGGCYVVYLLLVHFGVVG